VCKVGHTHIKLVPCHSRKNAVGRDHKSDTTDMHWRFIYNGLALLLWLSLILNNVLFSRWSQMVDHRGTRGQAFGKALNSNKMHFKK